MAAVTNPSIILYLVTGSLAPAAQVARGVGWGGVPNCSDVLLRLGSRDSRSVALHGHTVAGVGQAIACQAKRSPAFSRPGIPCEALEPCALARRLHAESRAVVVQDAATLDRLVPELASPEVVRRQGLLFRANLLRQA